MAKSAEYHLTIQLLPGGEYAVLDGLPSEHQLKSWGAHRYEIEAGDLTLWMVGCQLSAAQAAEVARDAVEALEA